jgi:hypothetical protein
MARTNGKAATPAEQPPALPTMGQDEWTAALQQAGLINVSASKNRLTVKGTNIMLGDKMVAAYNQMTKEPALYVRLMGRPREEQALWFDDLENAGRPDSNAMLAKAIGRDGSVEGVPSIVGKFCRSHFDIESENRRFAEDGTSCDLCPVGPWVPKENLPPEAKGKRCAWRGEVEFQIMNKTDAGWEPADPTVYKMNLATTGIIEFVGPSKNPMAGSVSEFNTMALIGKIGYEKWGKEGVLKARTMLDLGGVICELHILPASSGAMAWNVPSFRPIEIIEQVEHPALPDSSTEEWSSEDIPF